jgi:NAD-dependent SIR2 family protein deacetylase
MNNRHVVLFAGAGFSHALARLPLAASLTGAMFRSLRARATASVRVDNFAGDLERAIRVVLPTLADPLAANLEFVLAAVTSSAQGRGFAFEPAHARYLRNGIVETMAHVLGAGPHQPYTAGPIRVIRELLLDAILTRAATVTLITTNYDLLLDKAQGIIHDHWRIPGHEWAHPPRTADLVRFAYGIPLGGVWSEEQTFTSRSSFDAPQPRIINLYKVHGSINWAYCDTCRITYISMTRKDWAETFAADPPICHVCQRSHYRWIVVPPEPNKKYRDPVLLDVQRQATDALGLATDVIFIGYALADIDSELKTLVLSGHQRARAAGRTWRYCLFERNPDVQARFQNALGVGTVRDYFRSDTALEEVAAFLDGS